MFKSRMKWMNKACSEPRQTSAKEVFVTIVNGFQIFSFALNTPLMKTDQCTLF